MKLLNTHGLLSCNALREKGNDPNRRLSKIPSVASLYTQSGEACVQQRKSSLKKDQEQPLNKVAAKNNIVKGRTLIELQQARAAERAAVEAEEDSASET